MSFGSLCCPSLGRTRVQERSHPLHTHHFTLVCILQLLLTPFWAVTVHLIHHLQSVSFSQKLSLKCVTNSSKQKARPGLHGKWKPEKDTEYTGPELHLPPVLIWEGQLIGRSRESRRLGRNTVPLPGSWVCTEGDTGIGFMTMLFDVHYRQGHKKPPLIFKVHRRGEA